MDEREKLRVLIPHWIEHNQEHAQEFEQWAQRAPEISEYIVEAARAMAEVNQKLAVALKALGGPLPYDHIHDHGDQKSA